MGTLTIRIVAARTEIEVVVYNRSFIKGARDLSTTISLSFLPSSPILALFTQFPLYIIMRVTSWLIQFAVASLALLFLVEAEEVQNRDCDESPKALPRQNDYWSYHHTRPKARLPSSKDEPKQPAPNPKVVSGHGPAVAPKRASTAVAIPPMLSFDKQFSGDATFYGSDGGGGSCGFHGFAAQGIPSIALGKSIFGNGEGCGACVQLTPVDHSRGKNVTVYVNNLCPECGEGNDLTDQAWPKFTSEGPGRIPVTSHFVPCGLKTPISIDFISKGNAYDARFNFIGPSGAIALAEVSLGNSWIPLVHKDMTSLVPSVGGKDHEILSQAKFSFRLTNAKQSQIICSDVTFDKLSQATNGYACPGFQFSDS